MEYIVAYELVHLLEPTHNERFIKLMDQHMPMRQSQCQLLNSLQVCHGSWVYYREKIMYWLKLLFLIFLLASQVSAPVVAQNLSRSECVQRELDSIERWG